MKDIHKETAKKLFGVEDKEVTTEMRRFAKYLNFYQLYSDKEDLFKEEEYEKFV